MLKLDGNGHGHTLLTRVRTLPHLQDHITSLLSADSADLSLTLRLEPGQSLDRFLDAEGASQRCTLSRAAGDTILRQMASALAHLHARRIVHDDVKPDNIMWDPARGRAVLVDFGAALDFAVLPDDYFNPSGTPSYAAPEFLDRKKGRGGEGDVWALGIVMLFLWGYVTLPNGEWLLPGVWEEGGDTEMRQWLGEINRLGQVEREKGTTLGEMLQEDPAKRIRSVNLVERLSE